MQDIKKLDLASPYSLLMIVAVPGLIAGLLFLALIVIDPKWN